MLEQIDDLTYVLRGGGQHTSFLLVRSFGNYLIFSDHVGEWDRENVVAAGGIYKQFLSNSHEPSAVQCRLFRVFGASGVYLGPKDQFHQNIRLEKFREDFQDPSLYWLNFEGHGVIDLIQGGKRLAFLPPSLLVRGPHSIYEASAVGSGSEGGDADNAENLSFRLIQWLRGRGVKKIYASRKEGQEFLFKVP